MLIGLGTIGLIENNQALADICHASLHEHLSMPCQPPRRQNGQKPENSAISVGSTQGYYRARVHDRKRDPSLTVGGYGCYTWLRGVVS